MDGAGPALGGWGDELPPFPDTFDQPSSDSPLLKPEPPIDVEPPLLLPPVQPDPPSDVDPYLSLRIPRQSLQTLTRLVSG